MHTLIATLVLAGSPYPWQLGNVDRSIGDIPAPAGATRVPFEDGSFGRWLRGLPLAPKNTPVKLYNGREKPNQTAHFAVTTLDTGARDLQQCADAAMRLYAEYRWAQNKARGLSFHYTNGMKVPWSRWRSGQRPDLKARRGSWKKGTAGSSRRAFGGYLRAIMTYAGTASIARHDTRLVAVSDIAPGDMLIQGGYPGHAVVVLDVASKNGQRLVLLGQSYMPAQDFHVLKNPRDAALSPWFRASDLAGPRGLKTPEWRAFKQTDLRRFK